MKIIIYTLQSSQDCSVPEHSSNLTKQPGNAFSFHVATVFQATSDFSVWILLAHGALVPHSHYNPASMASCRFSSLDQASQLLQLREVNPAMLNSDKGGQTLSESYSHS